MAEVPLCPGDWWKSSAATRSSPNPAQAEQDLRVVEPWTTLMVASSPDASAALASASAALLSGSGGLAVRRHGYAIKLSRSDTLKSDLTYKDTYTGI